MLAEPAARVDEAVAAGVAPDRLVLDPGLGFAKRPEHDWALLRGLDRLVAYGMPVIVGASRKSFLGRLLAGPDGTHRPVAEREAAHRRGLGLRRAGRRLGRPGARRAAVDQRDRHAGHPARRRPGATMRPFPVGGAPGPERRLDPGAGLRR